MSTANIAVVGAGQLGSRHLQALGAIARPAAIYVVDPSQASLDVAAERFAAVSPGADKTLTPLTRIADLPAQLDLAIVATTGAVRLSVLRELLAASDIEAWVLEKVLFQDLDEYPAARTLLAGRKVWVNCAQRLWPFFIELKDRFGGDPDLEVQVIGGNWGLGCNAVHNTDIARFLWNGPFVERARLDAEVIDSKRAGFKEFTGELLTTVAGGGRLRQVSDARGQAPFAFLALHPTARLVWNVAAGKLIEANEANDWTWAERDCAAPFQSQLTTTVANAILAGEDCGLPGFEESCDTHVATLGALLDGARANGVDLGRVCPVT